MVLRSDFQENSKRFLESSALNAVRKPIEWIYATIEWHVHFWTKPKYSKTPTFAGDRESGEGDRFLENATNVRALFQWEKEG